MTWNFCPWCGHRLYQHDTTGCTHVEHRDIACSDPQCGDSTWDHDCDARCVDSPCDCTHPHPLLAHHIRC